MFNGPIPEETCYVDFPRAIPLCKKLGIEYVSAMWGFEKRSGGFSHPVTKGVVIFKGDKEQLRKESDAWVETQKLA